MLHLLPQREGLCRRRFIKHSILLPDLVWSFDGCRCLGSSLSCCAVDCWQLSQPTFEARRRKRAAKAAALQARYNSFRSQTILFSLYITLYTKYLHPVPLPEAMDIGPDRRDSEGTESSTAAQLGKSPLTKSRSMSDGGGTAPKLSPSPHIKEASRRTSKDDIDVPPSAPPLTPTRPNPPGLSLHMQRSRDFTPPPAAASAYVKPAPLSPKLDQAQIYASPTNILPRRSRGLDFSRAATSLHHSTLAESSPESSPTVGGRGMNIPGRRGDYGGPENTSTSLWSIMGNQEKLNISSSLGSTQAVGSDSSSSSDDGDLMEEDTEEAYVTTPQVSRSGPSGLGNPFGSPAMGSLASFQQRQRPRKHHKRKRGPLGLGFSMAAASLSKSPPSSASRPRRESISWQANQLQISGGDPEESGRSLSDADGQSGDGQPNVTRRVVTRRGNLLVS